MKQTVYKSDFCNNARLRQNFSYKGLSELYEYLEENNPDYDLDPIELCCEFAESDLEEALKDHNLESIEKLRDETLVIAEFDGCVIYQQF